MDIGDATRPANRFAGRDLTRESIIDAALALVRRTGIANLSMRGLATALDVSATALYYHVGSKDELLDLVIARLLGEAARAGEAAPWTQALEDLLVALQYLASDYPGLQRWMAEHLQSDATLLWMEMILRVLKRGGLRDDEAVAAMTIVGFYNSPVSLRASEAPHDSPWEALRPDALAESVRAAGDAYPTLAAVAAHLRQPDEALFRLGVRSLIAGFRRQPAGEQTAPPPTPSAAAPRAGAVPSAGARSLPTARSSSGPGPAG